MPIPIGCEVTVPLYLGTVSWPAAGLTFGDSLLCFFTCSLVDADPGLSGPVFFSFNCSFLSLVVADAGLAELPLLGAVGPDSFGAAAC